MFLYIKTNILRGYGIFKNDFAHPREPAINRCSKYETLAATLKMQNVKVGGVHSASATVKILHS